MKNIMTPEEFKDLRTRLGLSQTRLAAEWGVTARSVRRWEAGDTPVSPIAAHSLRMIVAALPREISDAEVEAILDGGQND